MKDAFGPGKPCPGPTGEANVSRAKLQLPISGVLAGLAMSLLAGQAQAQSAELDPAGSNVILNATQWLQGTLLGNVATSLAVIAVGGAGLMMLTGRLEWRRGATVIVGCFIVFGAGAIVAGVRSVAGGF